MINTIILFLNASVLIKILLLVGIIAAIITLIYIKKRLSKLNILVEKSRKKNYLEIIHHVSEFLSMKELSVELTDQELFEIIQQKLLQKQKNYRNSMIFSAISILVFFALLFINPTNFTKSSITLSNPEENVIEEISSYRSDFMKQNAEMQIIFNNAQNINNENLNKDSICIVVKKWISIHNDVTGWFIDDSTAFAKGRITNREMKEIISQTKSKQDSLYNLTTSINNKLIKRQ